MIPKQKSLDISPKKPRLTIINYGINFIVYTIKFMRKRVLLPPKNVAKKQHKTHKNVSFNVFQAFPSRPISKQITKKIPRSSKSFIAFWANFIVNFAFAASSKKRLV